MKSMRDKLVVGTGSGRGIVREIAPLMQRLNLGEYLVPASRNPFAPLCSSLEVFPRNPV